MFYFTCNESKIYESFTFWNKLQEKINFFHHILISEMYLYSRWAPVFLLLITATTKTKTIYQFYVTEM